MFFVRMHAMAAGSLAAETSAGLYATPRTNSAISPRRTGVISRWEGTNCGRMDAFTASSPILVGHPQFLAPVALAPRRFPLLDDDQMPRERPPCSGSSKGRNPPLLSLPLPHRN